MKRIATILNFTLLLLLGTVSTYSGAQGTNATANVTPTVLQFPFTPVGQHSDTSYVISWSGLTWRPGPDGQPGGTDFRVMIMAPPSFQLSWDGVNYRTTWYNNAGTIVAWPVGFMIGSGNSGGSRRCYVRYAPTTDSIGIQGQLANDCDDQFENISNPTVSLVSSPLPVELASFDVSVSPEDISTLRWTTISEKNNFGFYVQESADGKDNFATLGFVPGHGTTTSTHMYSYTDNAAPSAYYRLMQVDLDNTVQFSGTIPELLTGIAPMNTPKKFGLEQNYPNPFNPSTRISFTIGTVGPVSLRVYDLLGREAGTLVNEVKVPGTYTVHFEGSGFVSGVYFYRLTAGDNVQTRSMLLVR